MRPYEAEDSTRVGQTARLACLEWHQHLTRERPALDNRGRGATHYHLTTTGECEDLTAPPDGFTTERFSVADSCVTRVQRQTYR